MLDLSENSLLLLMLRLTCFRFRVWCSRRKCLILISITRLLKRPIDTERGKPFCVLLSIVTCMPLAEGSCAKSLRLAWSCERVASAVDFELGKLCGSTRAKVRPPPLSLCGLNNKARQLFRARRTRTRVASCKASHESSSSARRAPCERPPQNGGRVGLLSEAPRVCYVTSGIKARDNFSFFFVILFSI